MGICSSDTHKHKKHSTSQHKPVQQHAMNQNGAQSNVLEQDRVILRLKAHRDKIRDQKRALEKNSNKAHDEAKSYIQNKQKERALFALKRRKLYENMLHDVENQYVLIEKTIIDVESKVQLSQFTQVLKESNDLIKELEATIKLEEIQEIAQDIREREQNTREFNKLFEEHHVNDAEVDAMFAQFEAEVTGSQIKSTTKTTVPQKMEKNMNIISNYDNTQLAQSQKQSQKKPQVQEEEEDEIQSKLAALA